MLSMMSNVAAIHRATLSYGTGYGMPADPVGLSGESAQLVVRIGGDLPGDAVGLNPDTGRNLAPDHTLTWKCDHHRALSGGSADRRAGGSASLPRVVRPGLSSRDRANPGTTSPVPLAFRSASHSKITEWEAT